MKLLERIAGLPPGVDPDSLLLPTLDEHSRGDLVVVYRSLQERSFRREVLREWWRAERGAITLPLGPIRLQYPITNDAWGQFTGAVAPTPVAVTPTALGATTGRVFPFYMTGGTQVSKIYLSTSSAVASSFQLGIYRTNGSNYYNSGTLGTSANLTTISPTAFQMGGGFTYYAVITNANLTSATAAYIFTAAWAASGIARWGTVAVTAGALPASFTPGAGITATVGGWPIMKIGIA